MARSKESEASDSIGIPGVEAVAEAASQPAAAQPAAATPAADTGSAPAPQTLGAPATPPTVITIDHPSAGVVFIGSDVEVSDLDADAVAAELAQFVEDPLEPARAVGELIHANTITAHEFHAAIQHENGRLMQLKQQLQKQGNQAIERARLLRIRAEQLAAEAAANQA